jgi:hypothetical protein
MRTWAHWTARTVMLAATFATAGAAVSAAAFAAAGGAGGSTSGLGSVLGGNQANAPISVPATVCGDATAVLGLGLAGCQASEPVSVPASVCGNAAAVLGDSLAGCEGTASVGQTEGPASGRPSRSARSSVTDLAAPGAERTPAASGGPGGNPLPATTLAADSSSGMGSVSLCSLAIGALLAGAVAAMLTIRRRREVSRA